MKIDSHHHLWAYSEAEYGWMNEEMTVIKKDHLPADLKAALSTIGFDGSVAVQARQSLEETRWLLQLADENTQIKGVVGWVDLRSDDLKSQLDEFAKHPKFVGVRHVVQDEPDDDFILGEAFVKGIEQLKEYNLVYDILVFPRQLAAATKLVAKFPDITFVLDHIAKPDIKSGALEDWATDMYELAMNSNVYCKVSGMVTEADWKSWTPEEFAPYLDVVFDAFGTDRIMIGSDWPVCRLAGEYPEVMKLVIDYISDKTEVEKQAILGGNAIEAYQLQID